MKINFKQGGDAHYFEDDEVRVLWGEDENGYDIADTIVLCSDVAHPSRGTVTGTPSIAAVVGNNDENFMNFPGSMRLQAARKEVCSSACV